MAMSWREAIERVLREEARPLHYAEISQLVLSRGYYHTDGATPDATVNAQISTSIKSDGERSPFVRVAKGTYGLRNLDEPNAAQATKLSGAGAVEAPAASAAAEPEADQSIIRCLGMYWQRDLIVWRNSARVFGK